MVPIPRSSSLLFPCMRTNSRFLQNREFFYSCFLYLIPVRKSFYRTNLSDIMIMMNQQLFLFWKEKYYEV